tara:strand:- start:493 stop:750 length:258 start_codon:yes stop_codon:yes gene_type:complete
MTVGEDFENAIIDVNNSVIKPTQSDALRLYGLFKLVKFGKNNSYKPSVFNFTGLAKWKAWTEASTLTEEEAMTQYITLAEKILHQ